jgi:hypothetical protein
MADLPAILTSNSAYGTFMTCPRKRYWAYEAPSDSTSAMGGWERKSMSLPLSTGGWSHKIAQGLFLLQAIPAGWKVGSDGPVARLVASLSRWCSDLGLEGQKVPTNAPETIMACVEGYRVEVRQRGLDLGLSMDGSLPEEKFVERTIAEQSALLEAFGWAFLRVRLPRLLEEYELLDVEREEYTLLSGDVGLQSRCDAVLRRRSDARLFIYNLKTSGNPDKRWKDQFEVDAQLMTETLAVGRRLGERVYGVIIDGFDKGVRVELDFTTLKERPKDGSEKWYGQRSRLIYGYKCEDIPGRPTLYDYEGTTRKGWGKFAVWEEEFPFAQGEMKNYLSPVQYWVNWLPIEQVEAAFITLPPIRRSDRAVESAVRQIVATEQKIRTNRVALEAWPTTEYETGVHSSIDEHFPQNFKSCVYASRCQFYEFCHGDAAQDPASHGFQPRKSNHPALESE